LEPPLPGYLAPPPVAALRQLAGYGRGLTSWRPGPEAPGVLIFAQGRSGSTLLVELLNSLAEVRCEGEILQRRVAFPAAWAEAHRRRHRDRLYGFKVKPLQLLHHQRVPDMGRWLARMQGRDWRLIHLERRNLLRQVVSNVAAERYGYGRRVGASGPVREPLHVDPAVLTYWMGVRARSREQEHAALAGLPHETVCYEDDLGDPVSQQAALDRLAAVLGVESAAAAPTLRPANPGRLADTVANYAEIRRALKGGSWERYLDPA
jgi:LPS sulfotransferase NodH